MKAYKKRDFNRIHSIIASANRSSNSNVKPKRKKQSKKPSPNSMFGGSSQDPQSQTKEAYDNRHDNAIHLPNINQLEKDVLKSIIAQDTQVRQIITAIYRTINFQSIKSNILIIGNSGTGKTETIKQIAQKLKIPYTIEDATRYTQEGYYGASVDEMLINLIEAADGDIKKAQRGIIVIDEIDKKRSNGDINDVAGTCVLKSLLKIIEGTVVRLPDYFYEEENINFDTSHLIIIFSGAFSGIDNVRNERLNSKQLGFNSCLDTHDSNAPKAPIIKKDLVRYGMPEEFVGRIDTIVEMNNLKKEDLALILKKSNLSIFRRYQTELRYQGVALKYNPELFEAIAEASLAVDTGARELSNTVNKMFSNILYDVFSNPRKYSLCTLSTDIVKDNKKYTLSSSFN